MSQHNAKKLEFLEKMAVRFANDVAKAMKAVEDYSNYADKNEEESNKLWEVYNSCEKREEEAKEKLEAFKKENLGKKDDNSIKERLEKAKKWKELGVPELKWRTEDNADCKFESAKDVLEEVEFVLLKFLKTEAEVQ